MSVMQLEIVMPRLSDSMETGTIVQWLVAEGQAVKRGQAIVEIETDKATMEYEAEIEGVITSLLLAEGESAVLGAPIALIESGSGAQAAIAPAAPESRSSARVASDGESRVNASPVARRIARELGVDLLGVRGSGPHGRIAKRDVELAARSAAPSEAPGAAPAAGGIEGAKGELTVLELSRVQQTVARRMAEAKATVPHFYLTVEIDMGECLALRHQLKELSGPDSSVPTLNDFVVKACGRALTEHPRANGSYRDGRFELHSRINVGVAVASEGALVVPTVFDADSQSLGEIAGRTRALIERVRSRTITPPELSGATFTVSNLGMFGVVAFAPVINPPQGAILATGEVTTRPHWDPGAERFIPRESMIATLACDHRILYGADAARFLGRVRELLEHPIALTL
jgi:pyruvate dehydrogenase E2 component (dihydrolipoamide acetyltransferase)